MGPLQQPIRVRYGIPVTDAASTTNLLAKIEEAAKSEFLARAQSVLHRPVTRISYKRKFR